MEKISNLNKTKIAFGLILVALLLGTEPLFNKSQHLIAGRVAKVSPKEVKTEFGKPELNQMSNKTSAGVQQKVEFENDLVEVVRYHFDPHAKIPMHDSPNLVAIWLTPAHINLTFPNGISKEEFMKAGDTSWEGAQRHAGENLADTSLEFVSIQLKGNSANQTVSASKQ